ncbi:EAL domain-containing protein [Candidatus Sulfurimonas marisnigri]|uniref:EAL domain-containing protein n=1 Tax=Candidatus Sulfurimonas marisnigri TaxID=2740405 RepID=A0A7S7RPI8_9BACT|nr:EAL domain-containing protein [Candidatus Sulfurimonas marisnigri]QOY53651.1 EAL domain-containing protein [Candidatus Sulfurimonas marisnigri]
MKKRTSYTKVIGSVILASLTITLISVFFYSTYMKKQAILSLSKDDAKKTSMLIFESLYSGMAKGWTKEDIDNTISRLNEIDKNMNINVFRSKKVAEIFGKNENEKENTNLNSLAKAFKGEEILEITKDDIIQFHYPVIATQECLKCHTNAQKQDVLGVIEISYPIVDVKVSLAKMTNFFVLFIVFFTFFIFILLFFKFNQYLIKPIKNFILTVDSISNDSDISKRLTLENNITEINSMQNVFNNMLDSLENQFYNDALTGLPNRRRLLDVLERKEEALLMIVNIDGFQEINNLYGHDIGDTVLKKLATSIKSMIDVENQFYKLHADEYVLYCVKKFDLEELEGIALHIVDSITKEYFSIEKDNGVYINVTIGMSYGDSYLLTQADMALRVAKKEKKKYLMYESNMKKTQEYENNLKWTKKLKFAVENDMVVPFYQQIVDCKTQEIVKYESLMRIEDENGDYIPPIYFLALSKKNRIYHELTKIMIRKTFAKFEKKPYHFSINISVEDISHVEVVELIIEKLESTGIGKYVSFEILESEGIENFEAVIEFIEQVKHYGCSISIDDFGTGYSNFEYLMKLKVDYIKIDGSMIKTIDRDVNSQMVVETIAEFAKKMGIKTIAEFVHSKSVYDKLVELNIDYAQGYYLGAPTKEII